jgi:thiol-disulfide isomerase/thioredoxin
MAGTNYLVAYNAAKPEDKATGFPNLSMAFDYVVQASLHQGNSTNAYGTAQAMLRTVPYDDLASDAVNATVRYVQLVQTDQALILLQQRQPLILALLKARATPLLATATATLPSTQASELPLATRPPMSIHEIYADAIALPAMQQFADKPAAAAASLAELEAALPPNLSPDDAILTAASRRQYHLLGAPLPRIAASAWLLDPAFTVPRDLNKRFGVASVFLLFPDWCAQCVAMNPQFTSAATRFNTSAVYFYALLAQADPKPPTPIAAPKLNVKPTAASKTAKPSAASGAKPDVPHVDIQLSAKPIPAELLLGTPTLIVPPETVNTFVGTDFPLLIATDHQGIVRYIQIAPQNALVPGGLAEQIADRIMYQWPPPSHK